jgi:hypothetical protein
LPAGNTEAAPSIPWLAAIQGVKCKQDLAGLTPKGCFISAKAIERVVRQICETQKATGELSGGVNARFFYRFWHGAGDGFCSASDVWQSRVSVETARFDPPEQRIDNLVARRSRHNRLANRSTSSRSTAD